MFSSYPQRHIESYYHPFSQYEVCLGSKKRLHEFSQQIPSLSELLGTIPCKSTFFTEQSPILLGDTRYILDILFSFTFWNDQNSGVIWG